MDEMKHARTRRLLGIPQNNHHGSPNRSFRRKFNLHSRERQLRPLQRGLEYRAGTLAAFARATARIHGTGTLWQYWLVFRLRLPRDAGHKAAHPACPLLPKPCGSKAPCYTRPQDVA
jgi:hypothetical protein